MSAPAPVAARSPAPRPSSAGLDSPRLAVVVPARDEAEVLERKLRNLAGLRWPRADRPHALVVVDDGSRDGSGALARDLVAALFPADGPVAAGVVAGPGRGKARAVRVGLEHASARTRPDLLVLTDADVVLREGALVALVEAFRSDPGLLLASGTQELVHDLAPDGTPRSAAGGPLRPAAEPYDRVTAWVRALESRSGRVFSVHGQLLAWRAGVGLWPTPGVAADDLDLMLAARAAGGRVRLVPGAGFLEAKPEAGDQRARQRLRRAAAYFQALRAWRGRRPLHRGWVDRAQWAFYRVAPALAPEVLVGSAMAVPLAAGVLVGRTAALGAVGLVVLALASPPGRHAVGLARVIRTARRTERSAPGAEADRWSPPRRSTPA